MTEEKLYEKLAPDNGGKIRMEKGEVLRWNEGKRKRNVKGGRRDMKVVLLGTRAASNKG